MLKKYSSTLILFLLSIVLFVSCHSGRNNNMPTIGFVDAFEDATIAQAREGFMQALKDSGYSEEANTLNVIYRNAYGDIPTLTQIVNFFNSEKVDLIASNTTLATISSIQNSKEIPVFMMVSGEPKNMQVLDAQGNVPKNLFGVSESLDYIDSSFALIPKYVQPKGKKIRVAMVYNQAEPQSQDALKRARVQAGRLGMEIEALPVNNSADAQLVTQSLLNKQVDVFFANPDNIVFAAFETILKNCQQYRVPIFTSESGLVKRGAVAAYGADMYQWGYQSGAQAAIYLKFRSTDGISIEPVKVRKYIFNEAVAKLYNYNFDAPFEAVK